MTAVARWLAADPTNPVIVIGVLLMLGMLAYGIAAEVGEWRREGR